MEWFEILDSLSIPISILTLIITSLVALRTSSAQNVSTTIVHQRIKFLEQHREATSRLLTLCSPIVLKNENINIKEIVQAAYTLKSLFRTCYEQEKEIESAINNLLDSTFDFIKQKGNRNAEELLNNSIAQLSNRIEIYDLAYWKYIISQSTGSRLSGEDLDFYYAESMKLFENTEMNT